ncbi:kelch-like protein 41a [Adelges cooleyi]|uniref:kelch-like protein 41a n=1 Tax=Adelges cooleyi TaxID=133065 RepID=UPI0021800AD6|nr:kelch-like protein 41a [Adelges cooleyi]
MDVDMSGLRGFIEIARHSNEMRKKNQLVDFVLVNDNGDQVWGHTPMMASMSPLIEEIAKMGERRALLKNISAGSLEHIVNFMYTADVAFLTRDNVDNILAGASELRMRHLQEACLDFLQNNANGNEDNLTARCLG